MWIVGAGASISDSKGHFPSLLDLPNKARELGLLDGGAEPALEHLIKYLRSRFYGDLSDANARINLEHVLTLLEIDIAVGAEPNLLLARKLVLRILRLTLIRLHRSLPESANEYGHLVGSLGDNDTVITFNWDTLLDDALKRRDRLQPLGTDAGNHSGPRFPAQPGHYDRFLLDLSGWGERTIHGVGVPAPTFELKEAGHYIKAHGSIDWFYCANPGCRALEAVFPLIPGKKRPVCSSCRERTEVLIVPPTLNKRLRDLSFTRRLWTLAASEMNKATAVVVWGYSLPATDFFSDWLLRHARSSRCRRLTLINPDVVKADKSWNDEFIQRFVAALRPPGGAIALRAYESYQDLLAEKSAATTRLMATRLRHLGRRPHGDIDSPT